MDTIYLDSNATTKPAPEVVEAMHRALTDLWANPSSIHRPGQTVRQQLELARESLAQLVGCQAREIVWTSGGTESSNLCIRGSLQAQPKKRVIVTSKLEHSASRALARHLEGLGGVEVIWARSDEHGVIDVAALDEVISRRADEIAVVSIMWANNETGLIQPVEAIGTICREHGVRYHVDGVQWVGKMPVNLAAMPIDLMSMAAHKFHGPKGVGAAFIRKGNRVSPQVVGGTQERDLRGGTENVPCIIGMGVAARLAIAWMATDGRTKLEAMRDRFERGIRERVEDAIVNCGGAARTWNTSNMAFPGLEGEAILLLLSERGVCASAGAACSSGSLEPSPVLLAMGIPQHLANGSVRFSLCRYTTDAEIDRALEIVPDVVTRLRECMVELAKG